MSDQERLKIIARLAARVKGYGYVTSEVFDIMDRITLLAVMPDAFIAANRKQLLEGVDGQ